MKFKRLATVAVLTCGLVLGWVSASGKDSKQFLNPGGENPPGYTEVVSSPPGRMIFISGQGGTDSKGNLPSDFASQARNTFLNIRRCLDLAGAEFKDIVKINYYVTDMSQTSKLREVRAEFLNMDAPPSSTLVQVKLGGKWLLEVETIAVVPD